MKRYWVHVPKTEGVRRRKTNEHGGQNLHSHKDIIQEIELESENPKNKANNLTELWKPKKCSIPITILLRRRKLENLA